VARYFLTIIFILIPSIFFAQTMEILHFRRMVRAGCESSFEFYLKKKYDSVQVTSSQGRCTWENKKYIQFFPEHAGTDSLIVRFYHRNRIIDTDTAVFEVINPEVFPVFGPDFLKKVHLPVLKAMGAVIIMMKVNDYHWEPVGITSYRFSIIRNDSCLFSMIETSRRFSSELKEKLTLCKSGDLVLISEIKLTPASMQANVLPGVFEIE